MLTTLPRYFQESRNRLDRRLISGLNARRRRRPITKVIAITLATLGLSSCAAPTDNWAAVNLGVNVEVGHVRVDNLLVVTRDQGQPARLIGVMLNSSKHDVQVALSDEDDEVSIALDPGQQYAFQENPTLFGSADDIPGALASVDIRVGNDTKSVRIPIRNGSLNWLKPYVPDSDGN